MEITLKCECENTLKVKCQSGKYIQFRDLLEKNGFHYNGLQIKNEELKELQIQCKCKKWISIGFD